MQCEARFALPFNDTRVEKLSDFNLLRVYREGLAENGLVMCGALPHQRLLPTPISDVEQLRCNA